MAFFRKNGFFRKKAIFRDFLTPPPKSAPPGFSPWGGRFWGGGRLFGGGSANWGGGPPNWGGVRILDTPDVGGWGDFGGGMSRYPPNFCRGLAKSWGGCRHAVRCLSKNLAVPQYFPGLIFTVESSPEKERQLKIGNADPNTLQNPQLKYLFSETMQLKIVPRR